LFPHRANVLTTKHQSSLLLSRSITNLPHHHTTLYYNPNTTASAPAPAPTPNIGSAVAFAPESVIAFPAAEVAELAAPFVLLVAAPTTLLPLLVTPSTTPLDWEVLLAVCEASAGKTVVRVRVSVSSSSSSSIEVVV
jgi:hypothetical protein